MRWSRRTSARTCHLRHGLVAKLALKKDGNELCFTCHPKDKLGLSKAHVHTAVKSGQCSLCHNPHASQFDHLLNADAGELCYQCHDKADYEQKVVHKVLQTSGCTACHSSHGADQPNLLVKDAEGPVPRLPPGERAGLQEGARRLSRRPGVVLDLPQSAQLDAGRSC